ncbi:hypothetical protein CBS63078_3265 [Aspergillus niger]|nr:hypothetical protein CBS115989_1171 [Aspergillus niger]KAI2839038.1 hypothetical protein CBS11350_7742 [Aspergillus niger]KAI2858603.1 hypothetical protein CBS11232_2369 [Aspergillus niger]KAI2866337.1 hypothetical protein CBS12448_1445 [Aspergillus niger]KAI2879678.1 hypothetical protein CBS115988_2214 [Aspergillus niger]
MLRGFVHCRGDLNPEYLLSGKTYHIRSLYPLMEQHQKPMANISIGAEHQRIEFPTTANGLPTGFPPVLARRGVPEFMPVSEAVLPYHDLSDQ